MTENAIGALAVVAVLLLAGLAIRGRSRWFEIARIPVSLISGVLGLVIWQTLVWGCAGSDHVGLKNLVSAFEAGPFAELKSWPGWLIAVVFAGMLLAKSDGGGNMNRHGGFVAVARQGLMVWIIVVGQTTVGLWLTWWLIQPYFLPPNELPNSTAMLIETGFAGGHGTAAAMGTVYQSPSIGLTEGLDLGILMATTGLIYGLLAGVGLVNLGVLRNWDAATKTRSKSKPDLPMAGSDEVDEANFTQVEAPPLRRVPDSVGNAIEPWLLQVVWLVLALVIGIGIQASVGYVANEMDLAFSTHSSDLTQSKVSNVAKTTVEPEELVQPESLLESKVAIESSDEVLRSRLGFSSVVGSFPLFIYTLFGGWLVRALARSVGGVHWIDPKAIQSMCGAAMDLLVVAAVMTLNLQAVASLWLVFMILLIGGIAWSTFCLIALSRMVLPHTHWFELGLINFGMSTGTTATGFVLLRMVDPDFETRAAEEYALAAPISAPFIGGGMLTVGLPLLVLERIPMAASAIGFTLVLLGLIAVGIFWNRPKVQVETT